MRHFPFFSALSAPRAQRAVKNITASAPFDNPAALAYSVGCFLSILRKVRPIFLHRKLWIILGLITLLAAAAAAVGWLGLQRYARTPAQIGAQPMVVLVPAGQDFRTLARRLQADGLIRDPRKLRILARLEGFDRIIQVGEYELSAAMTPRAILEILASGKVRLHRLTIPEGFNLGQVADAAADAGLAAHDAFYASATDPDFARQLEIPADSCEGYLFPDTYHFPRDTTPSKIITTMVGHFRSAVTPAWQLQLDTLGWTLHQAVILASIIEKETGTAAERAVISSVFHNRLKKGMRLESDPTVIYDIPEFDGNLTREHLRAPTPYNTYQIPGLPPGPIANPGVAALQAALFPAETDYLFFVAKGDQTHYFSTTLAEHNRAVQKYQLRQ